jgi:ribonuclease VapC
MVIDTSAIIAILLQEPEALVFADAIAKSQTRLISTATVLEATMVLESRLGELGRRELDLFLYATKAEIIAFDAEQLVLARQAFRRFGKGKHPAGLNFGDCFSYALAKATGNPLLFKGVDFAQTDVEGVIF